MTKWITKKLGEIGSVAMCKRIFSFETSSEGEIPFYKIGTFGKTADAFITQSKYEEYKSKFSFPKIGDILLSASGTIGRTVVYDGKPAYFQDSNIIWLSHDEKIVLNEFLFYLYKNTTWNLEGSTIARLYNDNFNKIEIPIPIQADGTPDLTEQHRIAGILSSADGAIAASEALIAKYRNIKRGLLSTLLQPKEGWKKVKLGEVGKLVTGLTYSPNNVVDEGVLVLRSSNIQNDNISLEDNVYVNVTEYNPVQEEDVLICVRNGSRALIGKTARINKEVDGCAFGAFMAIYRSEYNGLLYHFFKSDSFFSQVSKNIGATINSINGSDLKDMEVYLPYKNGQPDIAEQKRIAEILSSVDAKIAAEEKVVEKYKGVKKGLMEELLKSNE